MSRACCISGAMATRGAFERLIPLVYDELHRMALRYLAGERSNVSLQATGLVNEVCLRLLGWDQARWQNRQHFFGVSAQMMRRARGHRTSPPRRSPPVGRWPFACLWTASIHQPLSQTSIWWPSIRRSIGWRPRTLEGERDRAALFGGLSMEETLARWGFPCARCIATGRSRARGLYPSADRWRR